MELKELFFTIIDGYRLKSAIWMADAKQKAFNKRYYVLPDANHKLRVFNKEEIKALQKPVRKKVIVNGKLLVKKMYYMNPRAGHLDIMKECFYYTSLKLNEIGSALTPSQREEKRKEWFKYMKVVRKKRGN